MDVITEICALLNHSAYIKGLLYDEFGDIRFLTKEFNEDGSSFMLTFSHSKSLFPVTVSINDKGYLENIQSNEDLAVEKKYKVACKIACRKLRRRAKLNHLGIP